MFALVVSILLMKPNVEYLADHSKYHDSAATTVAHDTLYNTSIIVIAITGAFTLFGVLGSIRTFVISKSMAGVKGLVRMLSCVILQLAGQILFVIGVGMNGNNGFTGWNHTTQTLSAIDRMIRMLYLTYYGNTLQLAAETVKKANL